MQWQQGFFFDGGRVSKGSGYILSGHIAESIGCALFRCTEISNAKTLCNMTREDFRTTFLTP